MRYGFLLIVLTILATWVFATGCGGDDDDSGGASGDDDATDDDAADDDATDDDEADDDTADDDTGDDDSGTTTTTVTTTTTTTTTTIPDLFFDDFESYTLGAPPTTPWIVQVGGATTANVVDEIAKAGEGQMLKYAAGADSGDFGNAAVYISVAEDAIYSFDVYRTAGASTELRISYVDVYWYDEVILDVNGTTNKLRVWDVTGSSMLECATSTFDQWQKVEIDYRWYVGTFDVYLDGDLTACEDVPLIHDDEQPMILMQWLDYTSAGYGGTTYLDNVGIQSSGD